jgi:CheY-like chemotaxis protein
VRRTPRILIVEDEFLFVMELDNGFQVLGPAANVSAALTLLRAERPDAAVLDVNLAGEWVTPVAEVLRTMIVPFILTSAYGIADLDAEPVLRDAVNVGKPLEDRSAAEGIAGRAPENGTSELTIGHVDLALLIPLSAARDDLSFWLIVPFSWQGAAHAPGWRLNVSRAS